MAQTVTEVRNQVQQVIESQFCTVKDLNQVKTGFENKLIYYSTLTQMTELNDKIKLKFKEYLKEVDAFKSEREQHIQIIQR